MEVSAVSEWFLAVHRAIWYPVFYAMGLERNAIDVPIGGWRGAPVPVPAGVAKRTAESARAKRRKVA